MRFVLYEIDTGKIIASLEGTQQTAQLQTGDDHNKAVLQIAEDMEWRDFRNLDTTHVVKDSQLFPVPLITDSRQLEHSRFFAMVAVDESAGRVRKQFITSVPGQDMIYQQKRIEAQLVVTNPHINPDLVPHIKYQAEINNHSLLSEANAVLAIAREWSELSAIIEARRLAAKKAIREAETEMEIIRLMEIDWSDLTTWEQVG